MTLTRERLEHLKKWKPLESGSGKMYVPIDLEDFNDLMAAAETALACKPRPIEEALANGRAELLLRDKWLWIANWWGSDVPSGRPTHFIPLSALPKPEVEE